VHQQRTRAPRLVCEHAGRHAVHGVGVCALALGQVDGRVGRGIDDQGRAHAAHRRDDGVGIREVELGMRGRDDRAVRCERLAELGAELSRRAGHEDRPATHHA